MRPQRIQHRAVALGEVPNPVYCYVLLSFLGNLADLASLHVLGISDLLCIQLNQASGPGPSLFSVRLNETQAPTLRWSPPGEQDRYVLTARKFNGTPNRPIELPGDRTSYSESIGTEATCYRLVAFRGATELGGTDELCAAPGVASFSGSVTPSRRPPESR